MGDGGVRQEQPACAPRLYLGPMAGVTDAAFRPLCAEQGCDVLCTEMISAKALYYGSAKTKDLLRREPQESPLSVQLFGSDPELMAEMAASIEENFEAVDVNMGCPVPKVVNNGEGSALMRDPVLVEKIVSAMTKKLSKPLTVKIRSGFDEGHINAVEVARRAEAGGAAAIAVHARTRSQYYAGKADWEIIRQVKEAVRIPVIGNGDVTSGETAERMLAETGCDGVMVARAARGNPWIFSEIRTYLASGTAPARPTRDEICDMILRHGRRLIYYKGEKTAVREMRKHVGWYTAGAPHSAALRARCSGVSTYAELEEVVEEFRNLPA